MKIFILFICLNFTLNFHCQSNGLKSDVNSNPYNNKNAIQDNNKTKEVKDPISEGTFSDARLRSAREQIIVIHISGAKGKPGQPEPMDALTYAEKLVEGFKNKDFTQFPTDIAVVYEETGKDRSTRASVIINGKKYETAKGNTSFTPRQIGANVDLFTSKYWKESGLLPNNKDE